MPSRKRSKRSPKSKAKRSAAKVKRSRTPVGNQATPTITIYPDGTYSPTGGVSINPGGVVKFDVNFPSGKNTCYLTFGSITFGQELALAAVGTIKVGS
jgi:hypothetical protein